VFFDLLVECGFTKRISQKALGDLYHTKLHLNLYVPSFQCLKKALTDWISEKKLLFYW